MILEALFLTALVMSSFYMCEVVNEGHGSSDHVQGFHQTYEEYEEESPPEIGPEEDPSIETIFTITLSTDDDGQKEVAVVDGWPGPRFHVADEDEVGEKENLLDRRSGGKGPMRLHIRVANWRENLLFNESV